MIDKDLMAILVCPEDHTPLTLADDQTIAKINAAVAVGALVNHVGRKVDKSLQGGLIRKDGKRLYPIFDGIPVLLIDESIELE